MAELSIPRAFVWRRVHSLMGLWLVLFLCEHLLTNSQAALWLGEDGKGFVSMVNALHNLPYLQVIEVVLLGIPILIHMAWGVRYALMAKGNAKSTDGSSPSLKQYRRNRAYTWQRITSWILLVGLIGHVVKFRFLDYPEQVTQDQKTLYFVKIDMDNGLYSLAYRLGVNLYDEAAVGHAEESFRQREDETALLDAVSSLREQGGEASFDMQKEIIVQSAEKYRLKARWLDTVKRMKIGPQEVVAETTDFGTATLLSVRNAFKNPIYGVLYTIFVLAACFHAFNGFWTFLLSWGLLVRRAAQKSLLTFSIGLIGILSFLGLAAIWGSWFNLRN